MKILYIHPPTPEEYEKWTDNEEIPQERLREKFRGMSYHELVELHEELEDISTPNSPLSKEDLKIIREDGLEVFAEVVADDAYRYAEVLAALGKI